MSRNYAELEDELITDLASRTGRDLGQWMAAIEAAGLTDKNAIIDWLRPQGLTFAHASWLERIHNNGGRPIYLDQPARPGRAPASGAPTQVAPEPRPQVRPPALIAAGGTDAEEVRQLLSKGKAFRPLAELLIAEIGRAMPKLALMANGDLVVLARPHPLGVLWVSARELRLGLDLGERPFDATVLKARIAGAGAAITHMLVLNDARQIGAALLDLVRQADRRANPAPPGAGQDH